MLSVFLQTLSKVGMLLTFMATGYLLRRRKRLPENAGTVLSRLCTTIFVPAYSISNLSRSVSMNLISQQLLLMCGGLGFLISGFTLAYLLSKLLARDPMHRNSLIYAFTIPNCAYFGYPIIESVFGSSVIGEIIVFMIPVSLANFSIGYALFMGQQKISLKRIFGTPMAFALLIGISIGLSGLKLPGFLTDALSLAGGCMSPCTMLLAGFMLGKFRLGQMIRDGRAYLYSAIRLVGIPLIFGSVLLLLGVRGKLLVLPLMLVGMPLGLNLVVYPESLGHEQLASDNAKMCFVSYIMALVCVPCTFAVVSWLAG